MCIWRSFHKHGVVFFFYKMNLKSINPTSTNQVFVCFSVQEDFHMRAPFATSGRMKTSEKSEDFLVVFRQLSCICVYKCGCMKIVSIILSINNGVVFSKNFTAIKPSSKNKSIKEQVFDLGFGPRGQHIPMCIYVSSVCIWISLVVYLHVWFMYVCMYIGGTQRCMHVYVWDVYWEA